MQRDGSSFEAAETNFRAFRQPSQQRFMKDADAAGLIAFLCGPFTGAINGAALTIRGGWQAGQ